jgi:hypothetical protein
LSRRGSSRINFKAIASLAAAMLVWVAAAGAAGATSLVSTTPVTPTITWATPAAITYGKSLTATQLSAKANVSGTFAYTPAPGTVLQAGAQSLSVTFTPSDQVNYTTANASVILQVNPVASRISWAMPAATLYGKPLTSTTLNATANVPGTFSYSPALGTILAAGAQLLTATFTPTDSVDFTVATASVTLTVKQALPQLAWAAPVSIPFGTPLSTTQQNATASVPGVFTYAPAAGFIFNSGMQRLTATFQPTDSVDYASSSTYVTLYVHPVVPKITWPAPAAISYGTMLTGTQLNASTSVRGVFDYTPAYGTILDAGSQKLSVTFKPTDTTNYTSPTYTVWFTVKQTVPQLHWTAPQAVAIGTALSAKQLNAVVTAPGSSPGTLVDVPGTYLYTPGAGTVLTSTGVETLHVAFTPTDRTDYAWVQTSVTLPVTIAGIVAWGDSLTEGNQGITGNGNFPADLAKLIVLPVVNQGINGQSSTQIGIREGAIPTYATVTGGVIPASGPVPVTFMTGDEPFGSPGSIDGVHGSLSLASNVYSFNRDAAGDEVNAPGSPQYIVDTPYAKYLPIFWEGRNNFRLNIVPAILPDIAAQVAKVPSGTDYLVLSLTNNNWQTDWSGAVEYNQIVAINSQLASTYKSHYVDVRTPLVAAYDPTSILDLSDNAHDEVPTSMRAIVGTGTLTSDIGPADTTFQVNVTPGSLQGLFILSIDSGANAENVAIVSFIGNTVTVIRNFGGNNTSHAAGAPVTVTDKTHLNGKGYQIVANAVAAALSQFAK